MYTGGHLQRLLRARSFDPAGDEDVAVRVAAGHADRTERLLDDVLPAQRSGRGLCKLSRQVGVSRDADLLTFGATGAPGCLWAGCMCGFAQSSHARCYRRYGPAGRWMGFFCRHAAATAPTATAPAPSTHLGQAGLGGAQLPLV